MFRVPLVVNFNIRHRFYVSSLSNESTHCPDTHFQCPGGDYCLPVYLRCNGFNDCPSYADELECSSYVCPGLYRCRITHRTAICLLPIHLCDGVFQCPLQDDELDCGMTCPGHCVCHGTAFTCRHRVEVVNYPQLRYLDATGSGIRLTDLLHNTMLIRLSAKSCGWTNLSVITLPNLLNLDLSDNFLHQINFSSFTKLHNLRKLILAGNPIRNMFTQPNMRLKLKSLTVLNLSHIPFTSANIGALPMIMPNLKVLDLSHTELAQVQDAWSFHSLQSLYLQGCPIRDFRRDFMKGMRSLTEAHSENFKLCCPAVLPNIFQGVCIAPSDEISSCKALLKTNLYRAALAFFAIMALTGNTFSIAYRLFFRLENIKHSFSIFVTHLSVSDCLMGLYLALIGLADRVYLGSYLWNDTQWKSSTACNIAGFVSLLSNEVSAFLICLITLDRFLALRFPFSQVRFRARSTNVACLIVWTLGLILAATPLLPVTSHWEFYSQTGVCIPLPITRADFAGHGYSFGVMIVCNLVMFLLIAVGQALIYWSVKANSMSMEHSEEATDSRDTVIARRLLSIAMTDFLCWFPIGICGVLAKLNVAIPGEVNVAMAIFVLPLNSALNPFIYTAKIFVEKRRKAREARLHTFVTKLMKTIAAV